ncbi:MAG: hypothetical protein L3J92_07015 [Thermoplasmata archaeon]|nr:hypothetical protein [Thermoplasmata archaeon]
MSAALTQTAAPTLTPRSATPLTSYPQCRPVHGLRSLPILGAVGILLLSLVMGGAASALAPGPGSAAHAMATAATPSAPRMVPASVSDRSSLNGTPLNFTIQYTESGLPNGTLWWVIFAGQNSSSDANSIQFSEPNGTYFFTIGSASDLYPLPPLGNASVGSNQDWGISFSHNPSYAISFGENGTVMPPTDDWGVEASGLVEGSTVWNNGTWVVLYLTNGSYNFTVLTFGNGYFAVPDSGSFNVTGGSVGIWVTFVMGPPRYAIQFSESGLPSGTDWGVSMNGTAVNSTLSSLTAYQPNGTYSYHVGASINYVATSPFGNVTVFGTSSFVSVTFVVGPPLYVVTFQETGLVSGTNWTVTLGGSSQATGQSMDYFFVTNGSYPYFVAPVSGYLISPSNGSVNVSGANVGVTVSFTTGTASLYAVTLTETGLANGRLWGGNFTGVPGGAAFSVNGTNVTIPEPNGTYYLAILQLSGYAVSFPTSFTVNGAALTVTVTFSPTSSIGSSSFTVTLVESGLPNGTNWGANLGGLGQSTSTNAIAFTEPNGTYALTVTPPANYTANYSSPVVVNGSSVSVGIGFSNSTYPITFLEVGLPTASLWTVTASDTATHVVASGQSTTSAVTLRLPDGTYSLSATGPTGYAVSFSSSSLSVHGASPVSPTATFTTQTGVTSTPPSAAIGLITWVGLVIAVVAALAGALGYARYRSAQWKVEGQRWVEEIRTEGPDSEYDDRGTR